MGLYAIHVLHHQALCDRCRVATPVACSSDMQSGRAEMIGRLRSEGWTHKPRLLDGAGELQRQLAEDGGTGEWFCPACSAAAPPPLSA